MLSLSTGVELSLSSQQSIVSHRDECSAAFPYVGSAVTMAESHSAALLPQQEQMLFVQKMQAGDEPQPDLNAVKDIL